MNKRIARCSGELISADDLLTYNSVQDAVGCYKANKAGRRFIVRSLLQVIDTEGTPTKVWTDKSCGQKCPAFSRSSWFIPANVYSELGPYGVKYRIASDYKLTVRYGVKKSTQKSPLARYRMHGASSGYQGILETNRINVIYFGYVTAIYDSLLRVTLKSLGKFRFFLRRVM